MQALPETVLAGRLHAFLTQLPCEIRDYQSGTVPLDADFSEEFNAFTRTVKFEPVDRSTALLRNVGNLLTSRHNVTLQSNLIFSKAAVIN